MSHSVADRVGGHRKLGVGSAANNSCVLQLLGLEYHRPSWMNVSAKLFRNLTIGCPSHSHGASYVLERVDDGIKILRKLSFLMEK